MTTPAAAPAGAPPPGLAGSPRRWWALAALTLCVLIVGLDATIINVALPTISGDLGADNAQLQWIGGAYLLALSAAMLPIGMLGDRFGHKRLLVTGIALFGAGSVAGGVMVNSTGGVITVRAILGLGAAMITPLSMAILTRIFSKEELPKAIATWTGATAVGMPIGPLAGGWLLNHFWWGSIFVFNVPVVAIALVASLWLLPSDKERPPQATRPDGRPLPFDGLGTALSAIGIIGLVYGTIEQPAHGWGSATVLGPLLGGIALLVAFVLRQRTFSHPLVDLKLFADRRFLWGTLTAVFVMFAVNGIMFVLPQYLQAVLGASSFGTGLRLVPLIAGLMVAAAVSDGLVPKFGARTIIVLGLGLLAVGAFIGSMTGMHDGYGTAVVWLVLSGLGFGLAIVPGTALVMSTLPSESSGAGTSLLETLQQVGGVLGVAALGSVMNTGYLNKLDTSGLPKPAAHVARESVSGADAVASKVHSPELLSSAHHAFIHGMGLVLLVCTVISLVGAALAAVFIPPKPQAEAAANDTATETANDTEAPEAATPAPEPGESLV